MILVEGLEDTSVTKDDLCRQGCTRIRNPICASDGNTYDNECMLKEARCVKAQALGKKITEKEDDALLLFKMFDGLCPTIPATRGKQ